MASDETENPIEICKLTRDDFFGEIALLTDEPRSATVQVISDTCKCLIMTKRKFDEIMTSTMKATAKSRVRIGRNVVDAVPLFKSLTAFNKEKLLAAMVSVSFPPGSYICRQGTVGHNFFIITEGNCRVTLNTDDKKEREVNRLPTGSYFGEISLMDPSTIRTANVISMENVTCMSLSRADFNILLKTLKDKLMEGGANIGKRGRKENDDDLTRKVTGMTSSGARGEHISSVLRRIGKFMSESLWNSLYARMYRDMVLNEAKKREFGDYAHSIMASNPDRGTGVKAIANQCQRTRLQCVLLDKEASKLYF